MVIEDGKFYFIKDEFFEIFKEYKLMENKESGTKRPCYFCFRDKFNKEIIWFVPISTKYEKYQNIFPTTEEYILEKYITENKDVEIALNVRNKVIAYARQVIMMAERGINIPFYNIVEMKNILLENKNAQENA